MNSAVVHALLMKNLHSYYYPTLFFGEYGLLLE